jgi:putative transposase
MAGEIPEAIVLIRGSIGMEGVAESFFSTLKLELDLDDNRKELITPQQLQRDLVFWIEGYYRERHHSTIGYLGPIVYEQQFVSAPKLIPA